LEREFESRLRQHFGMPQGTLVAANSGTSALVAAILALTRNGREGRRLALMPAFTFAATAIAAERCGLEPYLSDVDAGRWDLDPVSLLDCPVLDRTAVVIAVAPFGRPVPQAAWAAFRDRTRIPVVIDAAACFATIGRDPTTYLGAIPTVLSFHATKSFGIGEGGCVISADTGLIMQVTASLNFGFAGMRDSSLPSNNGKLSEYHAAVGLAELDGWDSKNAAFDETARRYRGEFARAGLADRLHNAPELDASYALFLATDAGEAERIAAAFDRARIGHRFWYGTGVHGHKHFASVARAALPVTERLGKQLIGMPMAVDLSADAMEGIAAAVREAVGPSPAAEARSLNPHGPRRASSRAFPARTV
jgi:dTDP-4-amino-4,6-dideoxygalactose transaminase